MVKSFTFKKYLIIAVALGSLLWLLGVFNFFTAEASGGYDLDGYAWSNNIGWISMNCKTGGIAGEDICATSNYKVSVNENGNIFGYAWSNNIGWIRFGGLSGFPSAPGNYGGNAKVNGNILDGWARACAGTNSPSNRCGSMGNNPNSGGWDGWISLKGTNYGVNLNTPANSYAWGSNVLGWIDFNLVTIYIPPNIKIDAFGKINNPSINTITHEYNNIIFKSSITGVPNGVAVPYKLAIGTNSLSGNYKDGIFDKGLVLNNITAGAYTATLEVDLPAPGIVLEDYIGTTLNEDVDGNIRTTSISLFELEPAITFSSSKWLIRKGEKAELNWSITPSNTTINCNLKGGGLDLTNLGATGNNVASNPIYNKTRFSLTCNGDYGTVTKTTDVEIVPSATEV